MKQLFLALLLFVVVTCHTQVDYTTHIEHYPEQSIDEKIATIFLIRGHLTRTDPDKLLPLIEDLELEANGQNRYDALAFFDFYWGGHLIYKSLLNEARIPLERATTFFAQEENDTMLAEITNLTANIEYLLGNDQLAEKYYLKSAAYGKASGVAKFELFSLNNYAKLLLRLERFEEAFAAIELYIDFYEIEHNYRNVSNGYGVLASIYQAQNKLSEAIQAFKKSLDAAKKANDELILSNGLTNIAIAYFIQENYDLSYKNFKEALAVRKAIGVPYYISQAYHNLGDYHQSLSQYDSALVYYEKALYVSSENNLKSEALDAYEELAATHELVGNYKQSNAYLKTYIQLHSELQKETNDTELMLLKRNHDFVQQRERILGLDRETTLKSKVTNMQKIWRYWIWIATIGGLLVLLVIIRGRNRNRGRNRMRMRNRMKG